MMIINPGSGPVGDDIPNTYEQAEKAARQFHETMLSEGFDEVDLVLPGVANSVGGRWAFTFRHRVTGVERYLDMHGVTPEDEKEHRPFGVRWYWDGWSYEQPKPEQFAPKGWTFTTHYRYHPPAADAEAVTS